MKLFPLFAVLSLLATTPFGAPPALATVQAAGASGAIEILDALNVRPLQRLTFTVSGPATGAQPLSAEGVFEVRGSPGRAYRVRLPAILRTDDAGAWVDDLRLASETAGDISGVWTGWLDSSGRDRLHLSGRLHIDPLSASGAITASVPISVHYE